MSLKIIALYQLIAFALGYRTPKVLIIGIDGVKNDVAWQVSKHPNSAFGRMQREGAWSYDASAGPVSISGASWASILTGQWCDFHGVTDNSFIGSRIDETMFTRIRRAKPFAKTAAIFNWENIEHIVKNTTSISEHYETDIEIYERSVELLETDDDLDLLFIHFDESDGTGHRRGFSSKVPEYVSAVTRNDDMAAGLLEALDRRKEVLGEREDWLVMIISDHGGGGDELKDHCASTDEDRHTI